MSIRVMTQIWAHSKVKGSARLLLLAIADNANDDGSNAWPAISTLQRKTLLSERHLHRMIGILERSGELIVERNAGPSGTNRYEVRPGGDKMAPLLYKGVPPAPTRGAKSGTRGVPRAAPEPSLTILEPQDDLEKRGREVAAAWLARHGTTRLEALQGRQR